MRRCLLENESHGINMFVPRMIFDLFAFIGFLELRLDIESRTSRVEANGTERRTGRETRRENGRKNVDSVSEKIVSRTLMLR